MPIAMTAHVDLRGRRPLAVRRRPRSSVLIKKIIRESIGFDGLLMSDDLSMKALSGRLP
jgi:beta-N-acetylhexosaminidase